MLQDIYNRKLRIREFFADTMGGFSMIWQSGKKLTILNLSLFVLHAILPVSALLVLRGLIDQVIKSGVDWGLAKWQLALFAAVQLAAMAVAQLSAYWLGIQQQTISDKIAADVLRRAIKLELEQYENPEQYDELHMAQQQSLHKPAQLIAACQGIVQGLVTIALLAVFLSVVHWWLVLLVVALSVPLAVSKIMHGLQQYQLDRNCIPTQRKAQNIFHYLTTDQYAKEVRMFGFGERFIHKFQRFRTFLFIKKKQLNSKFLRQNILIQSVEVFIATAVYCIIIMSAATGSISIGGLVVYIQVFQRLQTAITGLFQSVVSLFQQQLYLRQILKYLAEPLEEVGTEASVFPPIGDGVRVSQLRFTYPGAQQAVLKDIDMLFETGKITAIVGENGAGKSTLIKLLCGLYQPTAGEVLVGGVALQRIQQAQVQEHYTAVFQDFGQYQMTVEDNITFGVQATAPDALAHAMGKAGISGKVASFPAAHKTQLGRTFRNGEQLSGGQWQKIALARAFYKGGDVVILDEPTSAMDPIAEHEIFGNFRKEKEGRVLILVTHRLYNLKIADRIYVLKDGVVAEEGDFDTLLHAGGVFADIYRNQAV